MPEPQEPKKVSNNDLRDAQFGGGFINAENVNAGRIGGDIWNIFFGQQTTPAGNPARPRNEKLLLAAVKEEVTARLRQSLHNAVLINLGKELQPQQVKRPWDAEIKIGLKPAAPLPDTKTIVEVFDSEEIAGKLLILGAPGSGKTTTQLELAQALISRAEEQPDYPVPVLFNLSSWKDNRQSISDWLVVELNSKYGVSTKLGKELIKENQLLFLLDGLDELKTTRQEYCIQTINQFLQGKHRLPYLVLCSRSEEYANCKNQLYLNGAIFLQPLTNNQIKKYLYKLNIINIWEYINSDITLLQVIKTPLMLNITILAHQELAVEQLQKLTSFQERLQYLLDIYIERMLERHFVSQIYINQKLPSIQQTRLRLVWLAQYLQRESQTEFFIERIQPYCLKNKIKKFIYKLSVRLLTWFLCIIFVLIVSSVNILINYGVKELINNFLPINNFENLNIGKDGIIYDPSIGFEMASFGAIILGIFIAIIIVFILGLKIAEDSKIKTIEAFNWSLKKAKYKLFSSLSFFIFLLWLISIQLGRSISGFLGGLASGTNCLLIFLFIAGLNIAEVRFKTIPNHGIWKSAINAGLFGIFAELSFWLIVGLSRGKVEVRIVGHILLPSIMLLSCFIGGAKSLIQHFTLRLILYLNGYIPWNYARFLDYCTERMLLQRVGGRYRFIHKLLQDHFAQMPLDRIVD